MTFVPLTLCQMSQEGTPGGGREQADDITDNPNRSFIFIITVFSISSRVSLWMLYKHIYVQYS